ncbi:MAG: hypothetical protein HND48_14540 [Chloroflexi bacterium]|nr:hypothetical protein [Chloroflexota bacterium]
MLAFSGVVAGYVLPGEDIEGEVERRVVPDGDYTWKFTVVDPASGEQAEQTGTLSVQDADSDLPILTGFTISPTVFTPNQDGIADRVAINAYLHKPAEVTGYLIGPDGAAAYLSPRQTEIEPNGVGWKQFDYEGGVDIGADPPPDGEYVVVVEAQDAVGQRVSVRGNLTIADGGKPRAGILGQASGADVVFLTQPYDDSYYSDSTGFGARISAPDDPTAYRLRAGGRAGRRYAGVHVVRRELWQQRDPHRRARAGDGVSADAGGGRAGGHRTGRRVAGGHPV